MRTIKSILTILLLTPLSFGVATITVKLLFKYIIFVWHLI